MNKNTNSALEYFAIKHNEMRAMETQLLVIAADGRALVSAVTGYHEKGRAVCELVVWDPTTGYLPGFNSGASCGVKSKAHFYGIDTESHNGATVKAINAKRKTMGLAPAPELGADGYANSRKAIRELAEDLFPGVAIVSVLSLYGGNVQMPGA